MEYTASVRTARHSLGLVLWACMACDAFALGAAPIWALDPTNVGSTLPPAGRSLFDVITAHGEAAQMIPFPFDALIRHVEKKAGCARQSPCTTSVLIPLGRSLQRTSAAGEFFKYPRAVVAVTGEGSGHFLKDRLYLGYQEKANLIEVISYNEEAGRFEFQLVKNYRANATPRVTYAKRAVCIACHQNQSPIFSRQVWDETNANPRVSAKLASVRSNFYDIPIQQDIDTPNAIDDAVARANQISVMQRLWQDGCGTLEKCRRQVLVAALQYRLSGERAFDEGSLAFQDHVVNTLTANATLRWPGGLAIPNPGIPNRDPLAQPEGALGLALTHVPAALEPLIPRPPLEVWLAADPFLGRRMVTGIAALLATRDLTELEHRMARGSTAQITQLTARCQFESQHTGLRFRCEGAGLHMAGTIAAKSATLDSISIAGGPPLLHHTLVASGNQLVTLRLAGERIRLHNGNALAKIDLDVPHGAATVHITEDFSVFSERIGHAPTLLTRPRVLAALGIAEISQPSLPKAQEEAEEPALDATPEARIFHRHCAICHRAHERAPPNFLHGGAQRVTATLSHCAPRIFLRLSMGSLTPSSRQKTPMPPLLAAEGGKPGEVALDAQQLIALITAASDLLRRETGHAPNLERLQAKGYENLRPCLPTEVP